MPFIVLVLVAGYFVHQQVNEDQLSGVHTRVRTTLAMTWERSGLAVAGEVTVCADYTTTPSVCSAHKSPRAVCMLDTIMYCHYLLQ